MFDINPKLIGMTIRGIEIYDIDTLEDFLKTHNIDIVVLTLPKNNAVKVSKIIIDCGIRGIWNFSHVDLKTPPNVVVENIHLTDSMMTLSYKLNNKDYIIDED